LSSLIQNLEADWAELLKENVCRSFNRYSILTKLAGELWKWVNISALTAGWLALCSGFGLRAGEAQPLRLYEWNHWRGGFTAPNGSRGLFRVVPRLNWLRTFRCQLDTLNE